MFLIVRLHVVCEMTVVA